MIQIIKETVIKTHRYNEFGVDSVLKEIIEQYHYSTEEERVEHCDRMTSNGFTDSGQIRENVGTMIIPEYVWFGSYHKYE